MVKQSQTFSSTFSLQIWGLNHFPTSIYPALIENIYNWGLYSMQHFGTFSEILKQFCIKANAVFSFLNVLYEKNALKWRIIISGNTSSEKGKQGMACAFNRITPHASTVTQAICISANLVHYFTLAAAYLSLLFLRLTFSA